MSLYTLKNRGRDPYIIKKKHSVGVRVKKVGVTNRQAETNGIYVFFYYLIQTFSNPVKPLFQQRL